MPVFASDRSSPLSHLLNGFDYPAILVSPDYQILATNALYEAEFGAIDLAPQPRCYQVSHGYNVPCDQAGEDCPLVSAKESRQKARVLHIHQSPRGEEHVDVELTPIHNEAGELLYFLELLKPVLSLRAEKQQQTLVGKSPAFNKMVERINRVSVSNAAVLLLGESGTGKELAASAIHRGSPNRQQALVTLECAGLTDSLFESELFGHVKGAFTGAVSNKKGLVEQADGGTLFLDEIGDVPLSMQVKLLRLLETGTYRAVGSTQTRTAKFRLVCATHKNLPAMVQSGEFRQDLYYRINVFPIHIPALRERGDDLTLIAAHLLQQLSPNLNCHLTETALDCLQQHRLPGNIRELRNILNRAIVLSDSNVISEATIREALAIDAPSITDHHTHSLQGPEAWVDLKTAQQHYLARLMAAHNHNKQTVAAIAGISLRSLYRKLAGEE